MSHHLTLAPFLLYTGREATAQMRDRNPDTGQIRDIAFRGVIRKVDTVDSSHRCFKIGLCFNLVLSYFHELVAVPKAPPFFTYFFRRMQAVH